jgi:hypothetical protein
VSVLEWAIFSSDEEAATMAIEASQESPPKPATPLTFSETMNYFATENALYEERSRDANSRMAQLLQRLADALRDELMQMADATRVGQDLRSALRVEHKAQERTLWLRTTASELKDTRLLSLLSVSLLLAYAVAFVADDLLDMEWSAALLLGYVIISLGFCLPWFMDMLATHEERKLRELRRIEDSQAEL